MAKKAKASKTVDNWKKKKWVTVIAPKLFKEALLGESPCETPDVLVGKHIKLSLMNIMGDMKRKDIFITFNIRGVKDSKAITEAVKYEISAPAIKRMVRRNRDRLDESILIKSKDDRTVRIKPLVLTRYNTKSSIHAALRDVLRYTLADYFSKNTYEDIFSDVVQYKVQRMCIRNLNKVYPVKSCDIRVFKLDEKESKNILSIEGMKKPIALDEEKKKEAKKAESTEDKVEEKTEEKPAEKAPEEVKTEEPKEVVKVEEDKTEETPKKEASEETKKE